MKWRDAAGRWRQERTSFATKLEATNYATAVQNRVTYQRAGLVALEGPEKLTFGQLYDWYWNNDGKRLRSTSIRQTLAKHLLPDFGTLSTLDVTTARIETLLNQKADELSPKSLNHIRGFLHRVFSVASRQGKWSGPNPAATVERRTVPRRAVEFLSPEEVPVVLREVKAEWRNLFATAVYTGIRRGELVALRKRDVDLTKRTITVSRSWEAQTTKSGKPRSVPIHPELVAFLEDALRGSPSELVFPRHNGEMHRRDIKLPRLLRSALNRAGIVDGWVLKCRKCKHREKSATPARRKCPDCRFQLWPSPVPRKIAFHGLRHTTVTLLMKAGASLAHASRLVGHSDIRVTNDIYGHLDIEDVRSAIGRLSFSPEAPTPSINDDVGLQSHSRPLLTVADVAARLRISAASVYKLCESGQLKHTRVLNKIRVSERDLRSSKLASHSNDVS
ncbi:MAG: tyrosine-type recombinase/integrase [Archangium sp.]